ncbi:phage tail family protein [Bacillus sp. ISL-35]|uniref:distal tail protein Dit n=1 Tax=Bacillus sp. ISL-35 TaxID=2819122 RepID=UPI001BE68C7D|nr:distal tail protein Dit [Bacillus sp. ISL-35]MBT2680056.1 phage tail family protein [Bacillus sp. ISL-35]MBT2702967.1 phage tail family protein [Chryseobacterium sp. ISL-80]
MGNFTFNGGKKDYISLLSSERRPAFAPISRRLVTKPGLPGAHLVGTDTSPRVLPEPILIDKEKSGYSNIEKLKEDLAAWLIKTDPVNLIFDDEPDRIYYALVEGTLEFEESYNYLIGTISFICPDPYKYGAEDTVLLDAAPIMNMGTAEIPLIINATFKTVATEYKITHSNGKYVRVIWDFKVGDILEIDLKKRKVTINGVVHMTAYDWRSSPFMLLPGANTLTVDPAGVATTQITFRPRWL